MTSAHRRHRPRRRPRAPRWQAAPRLQPLACQIEASKLVSARSMLAHRVNGNGAGEGRPLAWSPRRPAARQRRRHRRAGPYRRKLRRCVVLHLGWESRAARVDIGQPPAQRERARRRPPWRRPAPSSTQCSADRARVRRERPLACSRGSRAPRHRVRPGRRAGRGSSARPRSPSASAALTGQAQLAGDRVGHNASAACATAAAQARSPWTHNRASRSPAWSASGECPGRDGLSGPCDL